MGSIRAAEVIKGYVETEEGQVHYRRCGRGTPSVLLIHATPNSSVMFVSALKRLATQGLHAVSFDLPNCGESYFTSQEPKVGELATALLQAAAAMKFPRQFDVIGHQTGATVALHLAAEFPRIVRRLVLWGVPILGFMQRGDILREEPPDYEGDMIGTIQSFLEARYPTPVPWQLKVRSSIDMLQTYERRPWTTRAMAVVDHEALLKKVECPVLCLAGDMEPLQKATMKAALLCQNGKYVNLGSAGSDVVDEIPDDYVSEVMGFLHMEGVPPERASWSIASEQGPTHSTPHPRKMSQGGVSMMPHPEGDDDFMRENLAMLESQMSAISDIGSEGTDVQSPASSASSQKPSETGGGSRRTSADSDEGRRMSGERKKMSLKGMFQRKS